MKSDISDSDDPIPPDTDGGEPMSQYEDAYHEGSELLGMTTLISIILGLIAAGLLMFSLAWALAT